MLVICIMTAPKLVDWERVEAEYRIGIKSLREIAEPFGITEAAIRKRAKRDKWSRDLTSRIRLKAEDKVRKAAMVRVPSTNLSEQNEEDVVEFVAENNAFLITQQCERVVGALSLADAMYQELRSQTSDIEDYKKLGEIMYSADAKGQDELNKAYMKAISLPIRIDNLKKLADSTKTMTELQRKIHKIDEDNSQDTFEDWLRKARNA